MITIDWANKLVLSSSDIPDVVAFKDTIREFEDDAIGMLYPPVISYKRLALGAGAYMHGVDLINGYQLRFPTAGSYTITGNLGGVIVPVAGVYVERRTSAAFATTSVGGSGPTAAEIAAAVLAAATLTPLWANIKQVNSQAISGAGTVGNEWGPA